MNKKYVTLVLVSIPLIFAFIIIPSLTQGNAQLEIEGFTESDKNKKFYWLQYEFYVRASNIGDGNQFVTDLERERVNHVLKRIPTPPTVNLWCDHIVHGKIYIIFGAYVFKNPPNAQAVKIWFQENLPVNKIDYAEFYLTNNNHHWNNPTPDEIIDHKTFGNVNQYETVARECLNS